MTVYSLNKAQLNAANASEAKPAPEAAPKAAIKPVRLAVYGFSGLVVLRLLTMLPAALNAPAPAPVATTPAPVEAPVAAAPAPEPAHELAWLAEDPEMAKRMRAECGAELTDFQCTKYWEIVRAQKAAAAEGQTFRQSLEAANQRQNDLAFCRQNPSDWSCRNGDLSGKF